VDNDWIEFELLDVNTYPNPGDEVLVCNDGMIEISFWTGAEWDCIGDVSHWMPLPLSP